MMGLEECVLHDVLGLGDVLQNRVSDDIDAAAVSADQRLEGLVIAGQGGRDHDALGRIHRAIGGQVGGCRLGTRSLGRGCERRGRHKRHARGLKPGTGAASTT